MDASWLRLFNSGLRPALAAQLQKQNMIRRTLQQVSCRLGILYTFATRVHWVDFSLSTRLAASSDPYPVPRSLVLKEVGQTVPNE
jgi:hypothetical protein